MKVVTGIDPRLKEVILLVLDRAHKEGKKDLSRFELIKIIFLLQVNSLKYAGTPLITSTTFVRDQNGPISTDIYRATDGMVREGALKKEVIENEEYGHPRHAFSLKKKVKDFNLSEGEIVFIDSVLSDLLPLTQKQLKEKAYSTEPMEAITKTEKRNSIHKGQIVDLDLVSVDPDVVDMYSDG